MISDIRPLPDGSELQTDVCVIGGGAVGIFIATALVGSPLDVCVLESGGLDYSAQSQGLAAGETSGVPYVDLTETRDRLFGGSTYRWGARGAPLNEIDFQVRPWVPLSGWPISFADLEPYYQRVYQLLGMHTPFQFDASVWEAFDVEPPQFDSDRLQYFPFQFGKVLQFGQHFREELQQASNLHVYLHAHVTRLVGNAASDRLEFVEVRTHEGKTFRLKAACYVLACGGIENPRLLLASNTMAPDGLCTENDLVGRCFMEHPTMRAGIVETDEPDALQDVFSPGQIGGRLVEVGLALSPAVQELKKSLNAVVAVRPVVTRDGTQALRELIWCLRHGKLPKQPVHKLAAVLGDPAGVVGNLRRHLAGKPKRFRIDSLYLEVRTEQEPDPESRVRLSEKNDVFGLPRAHLHWKMGERVRSTVRIAAEEFDRELRRLGLGQLVIDPWLTDDEWNWPANLRGGHHHMGTTRMSDDPDQGVVDANCRAHSLDNLYIAGSSVFPTSGYANPTPTLLALAVRLAEHLEATHR